MRTEQTRTLDKSSQVVVMDFPIETLSVVEVLIMMFPQVQVEITFNRFFFCIIMVGTCLAQAYFTGRLQEQPEPAKYKER